MRLPLSTLRRTGDDHGFVLVEVMVSALILILASVAVFTAMERSDNLAGNQQRRTIATNVAQSELERVRSLPIEDIANLRVDGTGKRVVPLNGVNYTVNTGTKWLSDGRDSVNCTASNGGLDYLQATTTVTWPGMGQAKAIKMSSLLSPSNNSATSGSGSLSVQVVDATNTGLKQLPVTLIGTPATFNDQTDDNGCVAWGNLDAKDPWELKFGLPGYVDANGNAAIDDVIPLAAGTTTTRQYLYDKAGWILVRFKSRISPLGVGTPDQPTLSPNLNIANSSMSNDKKITFASQVDTWDGQANNTPLFPFASSPYTVYAGTCASNKPPSLSIDSLLQAPSIVNVTSGVRQTVNVYQPALNIKVNNSLGQPQAGAKVTITDPCGVTYTPSTLTRSTGDFAMADWGYPYFNTAGILCVSYGGRKVSQSITNDTFAQKTDKTVTIPLNAATGSC